MMTPGPNQGNPVEQAIAHTIESRGKVPIPLVASTYDVTIHGGLAEVIAWRVFRNAEGHSIEATVTFPMPVHAVLYDGEARIAGRVLKARAAPKTQARETYEGAIDDGKASVLHEELIKGIHMISVGHIGPGTEIEVSARFALAVSHIGGRTLLCIPTTVGDVYGASGLPDSDDLMHAPQDVRAALTVRTDTGTARLIGGDMREGKTTIPLDAPIRIEIEGYSSRLLRGMMADGRGVTMSIAPAAGADRPLDAAVVIDRSGSMSMPCTGAAALSKHEAVKRGLIGAAEMLTVRDRLHLWEFDTTPNDLGIISGNRWLEAVNTLRPSGGGTEIGLALDAAIAGNARDIILVTDGKSHALDIRKMAARGVRVSVVLIGEDSLEANVGHLASLTGGEIFVPNGENDIHQAIFAAFEAVRRQPTARRAGHVFRSGMQITATWTDEGHGVRAEPTGSKAVAAYAASLMLAHLSEAEATTLAVAENLVTHCTSLVLVDEAGVRQEGMPTMRKVPLPTPAASLKLAAVRASMPIGLSDLTRREAEAREAALRAAAETVDVARHVSTPRSSKAPGAAYRARKAASSFGVLGFMPRLRDTLIARRKEPAPPAIVLTGLPDRIDWGNAPDRLAAGDLTLLAGDIAAMIRRAADQPRVRKLAKRADLTPVQIVVGALAHSIGGRNRAAGRVARAVFDGKRPVDLKRLFEVLDLPCGDNVLMPALT